MAKKAGGKSKLPKHIAGVKIPKPLRRSVKSLARVARQPVVGEAVAAALLAAAGALAKQSDTRGAAKAAGLGAGAAAANSAGGGRKVGLAAAIAVAEIARRVMAAQDGRGKGGGKKSGRSD